MNRSVKKSTTFKSRARVYYKKKPTKIFIDSSKNINTVKEKGQDTNKENLEKDQKSIESQQIQEGKEKKEEIDLKVKGEEKNQVNVPTNEKCNTDNLENKENNAIDKKKI